MPLTREQEREKKRRQRAAKRLQAMNGGLPVRPVADDPTTTKRDPRSCESQVQAELTSLPGSRVMQGSAAAALAMARILDRPDAVPQHPAAASQLRQIMAEIRGAQAPKSVSRLTAIRGDRGA